jgi:hypothetical protein
MVSEQAGWVMEVVVIPHSNLPVLPVSNNMPGVHPNKLENLDGGGALCRPLYAKQKKGRFTQILPTKVPDEGIQVVAKALLKVKGLAQAKLGANPSLPRS